VGLTPTVVTFEPHPRIALGYEVELLMSLERRLELLQEAGIEDVLVLEFDLELAQREPDEFAEAVLRPLGTETVVAGPNFRFGRGRTGNLTLLERLGFDTRTVPLVERVSSSRIRDLMRAGEIERAAELLGRAPEVEGIVVAGDARGGTLGFPTANLRVDPLLLVPAHGIYAGAAEGRRAAISIGTNPHYGGEERRVEAHLLDFEGDLYGRRLVLELWRRLRDEAAFESEEALVAQIARDVDETRRAAPPL
jgi:riboflavin kinase/FMN adenylyltransferase